MISSQALAAALALSGDAYDSLTVALPRRAGSLAADAAGDGTDSLPIHLTLLIGREEDAGSVCHWLRESLAIPWHLLDSGSIVFALEGLAAAQAAQGEAETAARLFGAAEAMREMMGAFGRTADNADAIYTQHVNLVRAQLDAAQLERVWQQGRKMRLRDVVALALAE